MKTIITLKKGKRLISTLVPFILIVLFVSFLLNSCKQDDEETIEANNHLKSTDADNNDEYVTYYQNELFVRLDGKPVIVRRQIGTDKINEYERCFRLQVKSGFNGQNFVSSAIVKIDGEIVLNQSDFNNSNQSFQVDLCNVTATSIMEVEILGKPGSVLEIWIEGKLANSGTFTDERDGHIYKWVRICGKKWMAENLAYLPSVSPSSEGSNTQPVYYVYDYQGTDTAEAKNTDNYKTYGVLYNWPATMQGAASSNANPSGIQGISPEGWHIPSVAEFEELIDFLGGINEAGGKMKETGIIHWNSPNVEATNISGFTGLPGGLRWFTGGGFLELGSNGYWWTSTEKGPAGPIWKDSWLKGLCYNQASLYGAPYGSYGEQGYGFSVRCVKN
jgi:uncharacterized protein (TIGR02145 family)